MRLAYVFGVIGYLMRQFSLAFSLPFLLAVWDTFHGRTTWWSPVSFLLAMGFTGGIAHYFSKFFPEKGLLRRSEALGVVSGAWLCVALCGAIPYLFLGLASPDPEFGGMGVINAFFESLSGFTTTGATILTTADFEALQSHRAFFLWRAMTQWFGGLGVIALFVVVLPRLAIAGRQLFFAEASAAAGDAVSPQVRDSARRLWILYLGITVVQAVCLLIADMTLYEAVVHSLTTMSAGGFSPNPESIQGYHNVAAEWVFIVFMVLSGTSFTLQYRAFTGRPLAFFRDLEFMTYLSVMLLLTFGATLLLVGGLSGGNLRQAGFQVASLMSSTGYASVDFEVFWGDALKTILILAMVIGGCAGSACGGPKVVRYILSAKWLRREITQVLHPRAVIPLRYDGVAVPMQVMRAVTTLVFLFVVGYAVTGAAVVILESGNDQVDILTGFSAALACLGNIGPAFGAAGPMGTYDIFSAPSKVVLAISMWVGRLEIVTVIALLHPHVWRHLQWSADAKRRVDASSGTSA